MMPLQLTLSQASNLARSRRFITPPADEGVTLPAGQNIVPNLGRQDPQTPRPVTPPPGSGSGQQTPPFGDVRWILPFPGPGPRPPASGGGSGRQDPPGTIRIRPVPNPTPPLTREELLRDLLPLAAPRSAPPTVNPTPNIRPNDPLISAIVGRL